MKLDLTKDEIEELIMALDAVSGSFNLSKDEQSQVDALRAKLREARGK